MDAGVRKKARKRERPITKETSWSVQCTASIVCINNIAKVDPEGWFCLLDSGHTVKALVKMMDEHDNSKDGPDCIVSQTRKHVCYVMPT